MIAFQEGAAGWMWIVKENFLRAIHNQHEVFSRVIQITFDIVTIYSSERTMTAFIVKHVEKWMFRTIPIALNLTCFFIIHNFVCDLSSAQQKRWELSSPRRKLEEGIASPFAYWLLLMGWRPLRLGGGGGLGEGWGAGNLHRWPTCTATMLAPWALGGGLSIVM